MTTTRTVTVLMTDLVSSTEMLRSLGPGADAVRNHHFRLLRQSIAASGGEEVKNLGDGLMVVFGSVSSGVSCAVAMQQAVAVENERGRFGKIAMRIGMSVGEATHEEDDYFGTPVVEAARLCARTPPGTISVTDLVRRLAGDRRHQFESVGSLILKGFAAPIEVWEVNWQGLGELPLPEALEARPEYAFVGRAEERRVLTACWRSALQGERQVLFIGGEAGIGKTRLAVEAARTAHVHGSVVLFGRCDEDLDVPFQPFAEALRHYVTHCSQAQLEAHVAVHGGELSRLVPELSRRYPDLPPLQSAEPATERYLLFEAVADLLGRSAQSSPALLILDDLHWAATPSLLLLKHVVRSNHQLRLLVIGTYRNDELPPGHPLNDFLADLWREPAVARLTLDGISEMDVAVLTERVVGGSLNEAGLELAHALWQETDGNPFFVAESLRHLVESGKMRRDAAGRISFADDVSAIEVPPSVREVVLRRLRRLSPAAIQTVTVASVIGQSFDTEVLGHVLDAPVTSMLDSLDEALGAALIEELANGGLAFCHSLVRRTVHDQVGRTRRLALHRRVAESLELLQGQEERRLPELAYHWFEATSDTTSAPDLLAKASEYAERAGWRATELLAYEEAATHFTRALAIVDRLGAGDSKRSELLLALGHARCGAGDLVEAKRAFLDAAAVARGLADPDLFSRAALGYGVGLGGAGFGDRADQVLMSLLEEAIALLGSSDSAIAVRVFSRLAVERYFGEDHQEPAALVSKAVEMARRLGDPPAQLVALFGRHWALLGPDGVEERLSAGDEIVRIASEVDDWEMTYRGRHIRLRSLLEMGDFDGVAAEMECCFRLADLLRQPLYRWQTTMFRAMWALDRGRFDEAERLATEALAIGQGGPTQLAITAFRAQLGLHRYMTGRIQEVLPVVRIAAEDLSWEPVWRAALAWLSSELGHEGEARVEFEVLAADDFSHVPRNGNWLTAMQFLARACGHLGDTRRAAILYELLSPYADRFAVGATGSLCFDMNHSVLGSLAGVVGDREKAVAHFRVALRGDQARAWTPVTKRDYAATLLRFSRPRDLDAARVLLNDAQIQADEFGMPLVSKQIGNLGKLV